MRTKRAFKIKQKAFFIIFKELSLKQIKRICLEGESPIYRCKSSVIFKSQNRLPNIFCFKDQIPKKLTYGDVYKVQ